MSLLIFGLFVNPADHVKPFAFALLLDLLASLSFLNVQLAHVRDVHIVVVQQRARFALRFDFHRGDPRLEFRHCRTLRGCASRFRVYIFVDQRVRHITVLTDSWFFAHLWALSLHSAV